MFKTVYFLALLLAFSESSPLPLEDFVSRIIGGQGTFIENHPYQVSLRTAGNFHFCGASIISDRWVLTAAHCTMGKANDGVFMWFGTSYLDRDGTRIQSMRVVNHPSYYPGDLSNDISLVQTVSTISIDNRNTKIIPMASHFTNPGAELVATGWGYLEPGRNPANQLQKLTTFAISNESCKLSIPERFVTEEKLCTFVGLGKGVCQGDSGSSLTEGEWLVGVTSWGYCASGRPDGFERVAPHRSWITQVTVVS